MPKWYDDWLLSVGGNEGAAYLKVELPNYPRQPITYIEGTPKDIGALANLVDKLLSELTHTKTMKIMDDNGTHSATPA